MPRNEHASSVSLLVWIMRLDRFWFLWWYHYPNVSQTSDSFSSGSAVNLSWEWCLGYQKVFLSVPAVPSALRSPLISMPQRGCVCIASPAAVDWWCLLLGARLMWGVVKGISVSLVNLSFSQALCVWIWGLFVFSILASCPHSRQTLPCICALLSQW